MMKNDKASRNTREKPPLLRGITKLIQVRIVRQKGDDALSTWRLCNLKNGVWAPEDWNDGDFGAPEPGIYQTDRAKVCGPPSNSWGGAWAKLVPPPLPVPIPSATDLLEELRSEIPSHAIHTVVLEPQRPKYGAWPKWATELKSSGVVLEHKKPFRHQADAMKEIAAGDNVVLSTGTASGKSLCYQLPILKILLEDPDARILYVSPMKALCADQLDSWARLLGVEIGQQNHFEADLGGKRIRVVRYDGDVKDETGKHVAEAQVVLTNSSMLHYMLARAETQWNTFFGALQLVVIDEVHSARGVIGANLAWIIRRLRRATWRLSQGACEPQFVFCSATIGNPAALARNLIGPDDRAISCIRKDTSGRGRRLFVSWTPKESSEGSRRVTVVPDIVQVLLAREDGPIQTVVFHRSRPEVNIVGRQCADRFKRSRRDDLATAIEVYISNVLGEKRQQILYSLRTGDCPAVFATSGLELGVDIGDLSAAIIVGIPHSRTGFHQMAGRVGRRFQDGQEAIVIYIPRDDPLHDWYASKEHFEKDLVCAAPDDVVTDPDNDIIARQHLAVAAKELAPTDDDGRFFGRERWSEALAELSAKGFVQSSSEDNCHYWVAKDEDPHKQINVLATRGNCEVQVKIRKSGEIIGRTDNWSALWMLFPGAVYFDGVRDTYVVESLHLGALGDSKPVKRAGQRPATAWVRKATTNETDFFTIVERDDFVSVLGDVKAPTLANGNISVYFGNLRVSLKLRDHFVRVPLGKPRQPSQKARSERRKIPKAPTAIDADGNEIEYPGIAFETQGLWFRLPEGLEKELATNAEQLGKETGTYVTSCLHGAEHLILKMAGTLPGIGQDDLSGVSFGFHEQIGGPGIFVYEFSPGGSGLVKRLLEKGNLALVFQAALEKVRDCNCQRPEGCPHCVLDRSCRNANTLIDKKGAQRVLEVLVREGDLIHG